MSRRLTILSALVGVAAAVVVVAILVSSHGGAGDPPVRLPGRDVTRIVRGIPQDGLTLGRPDAPVLLVEFVDPQCPFCREFAAKSWPTIVDKYIRTGKVRMELRLVNILGDDSVRANKALQAAALQDRMWEASMRFYDVQGEENSGYVTDPFLRGVLGGVRGLDVAQAMRDRATPQVAEALGAVNSLQSLYAVHSTPTLMIGTEVTDLEKVADGVIAPDELAQALNTALLKVI
jgi:protein-disulfide isomerase